MEEEVQRKATLDLLAKTLFWQKLSLIAEDVLQVCVDVNSSHPMHLCNTTTPENSHKTPQQGPDTTPAFIYLCVKCKTRNSMLNLLLYPSSLTRTNTHDVHIYTPHFFFPSSDSKQQLMSARSDIITADGHAEASRRARCADSPLKLICPRLFIPD